MNLDHLTLKSVRFFGLDDILKREHLFIVFLSGSYKYYYIHMLQSIWPVRLCFTKKKRSKKRQHVELKKSLFSLFSVINTKLHISTLCETVSTRQPILLQKTNLSDLYIHRKGRFKYAQHTLKVIWFNNCIFQNHRTVMAFNQRAFTNVLRESQKVHLNTPVG